MQSILGTMNLRWKLGLITFLSLLSLVTLAGFLLSQEYHNDYDARKAAIRQNVQVAVSILEWAQGQEAAGTFSHEQAQAYAIKAVNDARYEGKEYFWINDMDGNMVTHPFRPDLNGKDAKGVKDPNGNAIFVEFVDIVRHDGAGFLSYLWPKPGLSAPVEKVSYVQGFKPWGWLVGSGLYMDDLRDAFYAHLARAGVVVGLIVLVLYIARGLLKGPQFNGRELLFIDAGVLPG